MTSCFSEASLPNDGDVPAVDDPPKAGVLGAAGLRTDGGARGSGWVCAVDMGPAALYVDRESSSSPFSWVVEEIEFDLGVTTKELGEECLCLKLVLGDLFFSLSFAACNRAKGEVEDPLVSGPFKFRSLRSIRGL